jgi:hypothetical protein
MTASLASLDKKDVFFRDIERANLVNSDLFNPGRGRVTYLLEGDGYQWSNG